MKSAFKNYIKIKRKKRTGLKSTNLSSLLKMIKIRNKDQKMITNTIKPTLIKFNKFL